MTPSATFRIDLVPSGYHFTADAATPLLEAALAAGLVLPYGCRNGACGSCKARVVTGLADHGGAAETALTMADRAAGMTLLCCARALSDLTIECREVRSIDDIQVKTLPCRVQHIERAAADVIVLTLKLPVNERLQFLPGQYIEFLLKEGKTRAFSIANAPVDDGHIELHIRLVAGGEFTQHVFNGMKEKDILRLRGPLGTFFLREESDKPAIFVAGGTGFAPIKAIIEHALRASLSRPMTLYWGAQARSGLYRHQLPARWAEENPWFHYVPVLSAAAAEDAWPGRTGLVHRTVLEDHPDLSAYQVYVCGAPAMVEAARRDFLAAGLPETEFFADAFTFASAPPADAP